MNKVVPTLTETYLIAIIICISKSMHRILLCGPVTIKFQRNEKISLGNQGKRKDISQGKPIAYVGSV